MNIRDDFYNVEVPEQAIQAMGRTLGAVGIFGLKSWYDSLDHEFVTDLVAAWEVWKSQQTSRQPESPKSPLTIHPQNESASDDLPTTAVIPEVPPPVIESPATANGRKLRVKFKTRKIPHIL